MSIIRMVRLNHSENIRIEKIIESVVFIMKMGKSSEPLIIRIEVEIENI